MMDEMQQTITVDLYEQFISYLDVAPKTVETYTCALQQLYRYFQVNGVIKPQREDLLSFKCMLKASDHKPTTIQNYIVAAKLFFQWTASEGIYPLDPSTPQQKTD